MSEIGFEEAMAKLEDEVRKLESGNMSLDESLASFEKALNLFKTCNEKLENAKQRVRQLTEGADGTVTDCPFDLSNET